MRQEYIYVFHCSRGPCKIGISWQPKHRLAAVRTAAPWGVTDIGMYKIPEDKKREIERFVHKSLKDNHTAGEWFDVSPEAAMKAVEDGLKEFNVESEFQRITPRRVTMFG